MALIKCPECGAEVSDYAEKCMMCGFALNASVGAVIPIQRQVSHGVDATHITTNVFVATPAQRWATTAPFATVAPSLWQGFVNGWKNYFVVAGRTRRKEFWGWVLFNFIFGVGISIVTCGVGAWFWGIATVAPNITILVRRLHDIGRSGWHVVWWFVAPLVVDVILICTVLYAILDDFSPMSLLDPSYWELLNYYENVSGLIGLMFIWGTAGFIILLIFCCIDSKSGKNRYGENPKGIEL